MRSRVPCVAAILALSFGIALGPRDAAGQGLDPVSAGMRVRVSTRALTAGPEAGTLRRWAAESLWIDFSNRGSLVIPLSSVNRLEISRGTKSRAVTGAGIGLLVGTVATVAFLGGFCSDPDTLCEADEVVRAFGIIALPSAAVGGLIGLAVRVERWEVSPSQTWTPVALPHWGTASAVTSGFDYHPSCSPL